MMSYLSVNNQSGLPNATEMTSQAYVLTPAGFTIKLALVLVFASVGAVGFVGNILIYYFISLKKNGGWYVQSTPFVRNFNFYIKVLLKRNFRM